MTDHSPFNMKKCFKCLEEKPLSEFYKHKMMKDGRLNKCKYCAKKDVRSRHHYLMDTSIEYSEKERVRGREKYARLNYRESQYKLNKSKPWKDNATVKSLHKKLNIRSGFECHHWSYKKENLRDVFILDRRSHKKAHNNLVFIEKELCFMYEDNLLDTRAKHEKYLWRMDISYEKIDRPHRI